jgi:hypothetical protein
MPKLGEMLLAEGICTVEQLKAAVENQVIMGGRIGTNLLELGFISEENLAKTLAGQFRTRVLFGDDINPERDALAKIPKDAVERLDVIPYRLEQRSIQVLCIDPGDLKALDEVAFITGLKPAPIAVPELRFWQLLNRLYGIERELRYLVLEGTSLPVKVADRPEAEPTVQEDLISEEVFARLYQRKEDQPEPDDIPVLDEADMELVEEEEVIDLVEEVEPEPAPAPAPEESPLTFQEATQLLQGIDDRNAVARTVLRFAASVFKRCLLFTTHQQVIIGWDAVGGNIDPARFRSLAIPLNTPSVFQLVVNSRAHFLGGLQKTRINIGFLKAMGKQVPLSAVVVPILVRGRVVNLLYCDNGHRAHAASDIGELLILAQHIARCYEAMFKRKWVEMKEQKARERRKFRRIPAEFEVNFKAVKGTEGAAPPPARTRDISDGGILLSAPERIPEGTVLEVELRTQAHSMFPSVFKPMKARVRVVRVKGEEPPFEIGAEFVEGEE